MTLPRHNKVFKKPSKDPNKDNGTVLITTLLIMTVMAAITVALLDDIRVAVKRTINVNAYAQADWQGRGAEDFIRSWLSQNFVELDTLAQSIVLRDREPILLPTQDGLITVQLKDASHCFNLNSVLGAEGLATGSAAELVDLSTLIGVPLNQAESLSMSLMDWIDQDQNPRSGGAEDGTYLRATPPYRTADTILASPGEMRALNGMDEDLWALYKPFVCIGVLGELTSVNINTIRPEQIAVVAAALSQLDGISTDEAVRAAQHILEERPPQGYADLDAVGSAIATLQIDGFSETPQLNRISTQVSSVFVEVVTTVGPAERVRVYRYDGLDNEAPTLTYRAWGRESFRPEIEDEDVQ